MGAASSNCPLCATPGGTLLWQDRRLRIILVDDPYYPGFCRVVWQDHVVEMSDLPDDDRSYLWSVIHIVENIVRKLARPDKLNLAAFGNMVPHLHWHVIPRWQDDRHFPEPIWGTIQRPDSPLRPVIPASAFQVALTEYLGPTLS